MCGRFHNTQPLDSFSIIVGAPNDLVRPIHDRMPVILPPDTWERWLDPTVTGATELLLVPFPAEAMRAYPVSNRVGSVRNNDPSLLDPI